MKLRILITAIFFAVCYSLAVAQQESIEKTELENFTLITDQDVYVAGDRLWFAAKLQKNHETYRYSKLAYLSILDSEGNAIHQEKMLLSSEDMIYGDVFLPENTKTGIFSLLIYTQWMANFQDFPIAKKEFAVVNLNLSSVEGEPTVLLEQLPFENSPISFFHTSDQNELIEIQDLEGKTIEVLESVKPLEKVLTQTKFATEVKLVFRNKSYRIKPESWNWNPSDYSITQVEEQAMANFQLVTHTDWEVLERLELKGKTLLDKEKYEGKSSFHISILNEKKDLVWSYLVNLPNPTEGQMKLASKGKVGEVLEVSFSGVPERFKNGILLAHLKVDDQTATLLESLNHPNWKNLNTTEVQPNLALALDHAMNSPLMQKDYSPMFSYKPWSIGLTDRFARSVWGNHFSFSLSKQMLEQLENRKLYQEHFEISESVVQLQSPFQADKIYQFADYEEFATLESFLKEIVPQVKLKKSKTTDLKDIYVANTDNQHVKFDKKPLVLIDFYKPISDAELWKIDMNSLDRIEIYYHRATVEGTNLGEKVGDGLIVIFTKNNEYALKNNLPKTSYFLADVNVPRLPSFSASSPAQVSGNALQFLDADLKFSRGKLSGGKLIFDTAGRWYVQAWLFGTSGYANLHRELTIEP